ncbi:uncharacterized protein METZ01_LOCUS311316, partial [marine metagenome]
DLSYLHVYASSLWDDGKGSTGRIFVSAVYGIFYLTYIQM